MLIKDAKLKSIDELDVLASDFRVLLKFFELLLFEVLFKSSSLSERVGRDGDEESGIERNEELEKLEAEDDDDVDDADDVEEEGDFGRVESNANAGCIFVLSLFKSLD